MEMLKDVKAAIYHGQKNQQSGNHPNEQFKIFIHAARIIIPPAPGCKEIQAGLSGTPGTVFDGVNTLGTGRPAAMWAITSSSVFGPGMRATSSFWRLRYFCHADDASATSPGSELINWSNSIALNPSPWEAVTM